jgi:hypothetical protein
MNGGLQHLEAGDSGEAWCVALSGGDVYAGGQDSGRGKTGAIWKNGVVQYVTPLGSGGRRARVTSLFVSGDDVYAAVTDTIDEYNSPVGLKSRVTLWKNGELQYLPCYGVDGTYAEAVFVEGDDVYVAGNERKEDFGTLPVLWKNGVQQKLPSGSYNQATTKSLFVLDGNVYVAGYQSTGTGMAIPTLWINGEAIDLRPSGLWSIAWSVFVVPKER